MMKSDCVEECSTKYFVTVMKNMEASRI